MLLILFKDLVISGFGFTILFFYLGQFNIKDGSFT